LARITTGEKNDNRDRDAVMQDVVLPSASTARKIRNRDAQPLDTGRRGFSWRPFLGPA
jgi:hypothetical protein